jgi:hypothetical protein
MSETDHLVYVSSDGNYGEADGLVILNVKDLGKRGEFILRDAFDRGENLYNWLMSEIYEKDVKTEAYIVDKTTHFFTNKTVDTVYSQLENWRKLKRKGLT